MVCAASVLSVERQRTSIARPAMTDYPRLDLRRGHERAVAEPMGHVEIRLLYRAESSTSADISGDVAT